MAAPVCSPVYSAASHSLARKQMLASAGPTDNAENIHSSFVDPSFDLDHTIFTTLRSLLKRALTTARLNVRHEWKDQAAREVETIYASLIKPPPADDTALFKFMAEECDFGMEHADGSFMDHLHFCHEYSLLHFAQLHLISLAPPMDKSLAFQASPRILLLHSILGVGTNCFPMRIEKLPTLASLLSETEMLHIEAFPAVLRLLVRGPLIDELERIAEEGKEIQKISFYRVIDNGHYSLSGEELWTHLNFHLIHALDFLPVLAWKETKHSDFMFHIFTRLYAIITRAAKLQAHINFDLSWERESIPGTRTTDLTHYLVDQIPSWVTLKAARKTIEEYSAAVGHNLDFTITTKNQ
ncbi:MAG: hypothetical protein SGPRY_007121 [Prymnesium sp.]